MSYVVHNVLGDGKVYDITPLVERIRWSGDIRQAPRKLELEILYSRDYYFPRYEVPLGSLLLLYNGEGKELIRGVVFDRQKTTEGGQQVTAYDHAVYLVKSKGTMIFRNTTASAIIRQLCSWFGVPAGDIPDTGVNLEKLIMRNKTIYDMMVIALTETSKRNGKKYQIRMKEGKLHVIEKGAQVVRWLVTEGQNLIEAEYRESIEEMRNRIIIMGDKDQVLAEVKDMDLIRQYGLLSELRQEGDIKAAEAQVMAQNLLRDLGKVFREAGITCLGIDDVEAGTAIEVQEGLTGLTGTFYVDTDEHTVENGQHIMRLKLNWTDEVATMEADKE